MDHFCSRGCRYVDVRVLGRNAHVEGLGPEGGGITLPQNVCVYLQIQTALQLRRQKPYKPKIWKGYANYEIYYIKKIGLSVIVVMNNLILGLPVRNKKGQKFQSSGWLT
jgi:hypothetical protein